MSDPALIALIGLAVCLANIVADLVKRLGSKSSPATAPAACALSAQDNVQRAEFTQLCSSARETTELLREVKAEQARTTRAVERLVDSHS